jgi:tripartite-type tricarboxylate transporter receptor subunit TctC
MKKMTLSFFLVSCLFVVLFDGGGWSQAQQQDSAYPTKPVQVIVPYAAGGGTDINARLMAHYMKKNLGQPIAVVNRPGASGALGHREIAHTKPDGYTLGVLSYPDSAINPKGESAGFRNEDFVPLATFTRTPSVLAVQKDGPFKTIQEFTAYAKKNPGKITVAVGGQAHKLCVILIEQAMGIDLNPVMFKSGNEAMKTLMGGHTMAAIAASQYIAGDAESKGVLALALTGEKRLATFPNVPTFKELGHEVPIEMMRIFCVPKDVSAAIQKKLLAALVELDKDQEFVGKVKAAGEIYNPLFGSNLENYYRKTNAVLSVTVEKFKEQFSE